VSFTTAVPDEVLAAANPGGTGLPLCPACHLGRLRPYKVEVQVSDAPRGWDGVNYLFGWVLVCLAQDGAETELHPLGCGFTMPVTAHRYNAPRHAAQDTDGAEPVDADNQ
jgi:hypothetical protein